MSGFCLTMSAYINSLTNCGLWGKIINKVGHSRGANVIINGPLLVDVR